ncbi:MAG: MSHA biogenesis protein MshK [Pseudomonadota bacterium]
MDEAVKTLLAAMLLSATVARAQALPDPTQPPASLLAPVAGANAVPSAPALPQLQSILVARGEGGRRVAVIDGQPVRVGERINGAVVATIGEADVVLMRGAEKLVLRLYPKADTKSAPAR